QHGLLTTIAWALGEAEHPQITYALEGSVFVAGAAVQWLRDGLGVIKQSVDVETLARQVDDAHGVYLVPAFTGLGAPYWDTQARGAILGLTRGTTAAHIARATLESMAYQTRDVLDAMQADAGMAMQALRVDGGASVNDLLMQFQADILGVTTQRPHVRETTALGAAYLAGLATGVWHDQEELASHWALDRAFTPEMPAERRERLYAGWRKAVSRARDWAEPE
ncbi:MAG TPA: FGGY-family carbohydrate kinase, partial [Ktedonobacterales bacterium]|nr:FGGY-family carbohydrate kinase [Ktedonobacterales bacterium]